jgi:hypothetical protein
MSLPSSAQPPGEVPRLFIQEARRHPVNASDFVKRLADAASSEADYVALGLSKKVAAEFRKKYFCSKRKVPLSIPESNELLALMDVWHTGDIEVGMIRLLDRPVQTRRGLQIGEVEADPLILMGATGELIVEELGTDGHQLWPVAKSGESFLNAIIVAAEFLESRATGKVDFEDFDAAKAAAKECVELAGGSRYHDFYTMLLGAEA